LLGSVLAGRNFATTTALAHAVRKAIPGKVDDEDRELSVRRVFQALRILVNDEFSALDTLLRHLPNCLAPGGRVAILTFHSGEDRRVKKAFAAGVRDGFYAEVAREVIRPSPAERHENPRSTVGQASLGKKGITRGHTVVNRAESGSRAVLKLTLRLDSSAQHKDTCSAVSSSSSTDLPSDPLLEAKNLRVWFPVRTGIFRRHTDDVKAVDDVSFSIPRGSTVGLVGESGSGKTTIGRAILKLVPATGGQVIFDGNDILPMPEGQFRPFRRRVQMIFQDPFGSLNPRHTIFQIIGEAMEIHFPSMSSSQREQRVSDLLKQVGLKPEMMHRYPHEFSGGQRQRIGIARALAVEPEFIVCDEPVSALDVSVQAQIVNLLQDLQEQLGLTYLVHRS
jgi:peptide/nickel transport system ATP-binding protein/oligopeptide transport system ATP-binding protein